MLWSRVLARLFKAGRGKVPVADPARLALEAYSALSRGDIGGAQALLSPLRAHSPPDADVLFVQGLIHAARRELEPAASSFKEAIRLREDFGAAWTQLGLVLRDANAMEDALHAFESAAALQPGTPEIHQHLGITRYQSRDVAGAIAASSAALALRADMNEARFVLAEALLAAGDFERGWAEYEHRPHLDAAMSGVRAPRWDGSPLARLAVVAEQGLGDVLMFARLLPRLREYARSIGVFVQPSLVELMRESQLADEARSVDEIGATHSYDAYVPLMSLPHTLALRPDDLGANTPYLGVARARLSAWREKAGTRDGALRVGLAWGGNASHARDSDRSIPAAALAPLSDVRAVSFYSLQVGRADLGRPPFAYIDYTHDLRNMADSAALIDGLDLVISVDSAIAHLTGALDRPVWVLCPYRADWRWEIDGRKSPWYSSARVFRPERTAQWTPVIARVAEALAGAALRPRT